MINRKFGWTNVDAPLIGQGTWLIENGNGNDSYGSRAINAL
jgi:hypothetical protein